MKKLNVLTRMLLLVALLVGSVSVWGQGPDLSSMVWSTPIVNENFNSCSAAMASATKSSVTNYSSMGEFNCVYNNNTSNKYGIENNTTLGSNALKLSAGSASPVISAISGKSFATKGAYSFKITRASKCYIGLFNETISATPHAKAKATAYLQQSAGTLSICDGNSWVYVGSFTSTDVLEICVIYNSTESAASYGDNVSLAAKKAHIYVNGTCVMDGENPKAFTIPGVAALGFRVAPLTTSGNVAIVDDVKIYDTLPTATPSVTSLTVKTAPTKVRYEVGENLSMTGFVLDADGTEVSSGYTMTMGGAAITNGATLSSAGKKTLVVSYGGKTVEQHISVGSVTEIAVTTPPTKTSYDTGDSFDPTGMVVTASLSTGEAEDPDTWTKEVTDYTVDPEDNLAPANTNVTISYATKTAQQAITVTDVAVTGVYVKASTTIEKGKTENLFTTLAFTPDNATNKNVSWESDDTSVATVTAAGVVTGVAAGTANITVTTEDGVKTATCVVTVVNQKGTIDAPYSVADVIDGTATGNGIYVKGFIVGEYVGKKTDPKTSGFTTNANIAISDPFTTSPTASGSIPVALPTDALKNAWGCDGTNGALLGYEVLIKGNAQTYFEVNGIKSTSEVSAVSVPVKITAAKYATFASDSKLDFSSMEDEGLYAYTATVEGDELTFTKVTVSTAAGSTAVGEGLLLYADVNEPIIFNVPVATGNPEAVDGNKLVRGTGAAVASTDDGGATYNYVLSNNGGEVNFYRANNKVVATNKAYLKDIPAAVAGAKFFLPTGEDETDGIRSIENGKLRIENSNYYNLAGQRVGKDYKGIVIVNGKKIVRK